MSHHSPILLRSRFKDSATATLTLGDGTTVIKVESSALPLFSSMEKNQRGTGGTIMGPKQLLRGTPDTTLASLHPDNRPP